MRYTVIILPTAKAEIKEAYQWIFDETPAQAAKWLSGISDAINSLSTFPERCALAPESNAFDVEVRQLLYGKKHSIYRVLFTIKDDTVFILRVRHSSRQSITAEDEDDEQVKP